MFLSKDTVEFILDVAGETKFGTILKKAERNLQKEANEAISEKADAGTRLKKAKIDMTVAKRRARSADRGLRIVQRYID